MSDERNSEIKLHMQNNCWLQYKVALYTIRFTQIQGKKNTFLQIFLQVYIIQRNTLLELQEK